MKRSAFGIVVLMGLGWFSSAQAEETDAEKGLKSFGDFVVGGVWKTEAAGKTMAAQYAWFGNKNFLRVKATTDGQPDDMVMIIGIDPSTKGISMWGFSATGLQKSSMTRHEKGVWHVAATFAGEKGATNTWKGKFVRIGKDELRMETTELTVGGATRDADAAGVWKRHDKETKAEK